ncbi:MAG: 4-vinyl reductase [Deltaproteobacteria bacterium]|jgi:predicted hydrocarbon binding protein|nr:4-vinyl reductase [Deltaproteobacteria bacterium]
MAKPRYTFYWDLIGDVDARENLGPLVRVEVYRLMQLCFREVLEKHYGTEQADDLFRDGGRLAGEHFYKRFLADPGSPDLSSFVTKMQTKLRDLGIGIVRVEKANLEQGTLVLTVDEDLDCSGLPDLDHEFCAYDEGFFEGVLSSYMQRKFRVREVDCWCTGARTCRFMAEIV